VTVQIRDAATVMLVRDAPGGMEVFMLRRNLKSEFVGGAYVCPGGAVDDADRDDPELDELCVGRTDDDASRALDVDHGGLAYWVAAIRECFEEAGVLLARGADGEVASFADDAVAARFEEHRAAVDRGERRLVEVCHREGLHLAVADMHYFAHWITPEGPPRRYDTRFFVCQTPPEQEPLHDNRETVASTWIRPADALERCAAGELEMITPTLKNVEAIGRFDDTASLLDAAARIGNVPTVVPKIVEAPESEIASGGHGVRILLPGDEGYAAV
jgi:8-oxo-dGTP pyrophosphatase MutT (NUDIX family)